jgi:Paraquat-inducible protein A
MILLGLANGLTFFEISFLGDHRNGMIISGAIQLTRYSTAISGVGVLVALISIIIPALTLALTFSVLVRLISVDRENTRFSACPCRGLEARASLASVEHTRCLPARRSRRPQPAERLADVAIGAGGYALAAFVFVQVLLEQSLGRQRVWRAIGDPARYTPKPGGPWILCLGCEFVTPRSRYRFRWAPPLPAMWFAARSAPTRQPRDNGRVHSGGVYPLPAGQCPAGANDHPVWPHRALYNSRRRARSRSGRVMAFGASRLIRLDPRAGPEARRVELVLDRDPFPLCMAAAGADCTLPADRLHWAGGRISTCS